MALLPAYWGAKPLRIYPQCAEELALVATILASPADDLPRLVYCDWLEEQNDCGDAAFAAFIRRSIEAAQVDVGHGPPDPARLAMWRDAEDMATLPADGTGAPEFGWNGWLTGGTEPWRPNGHSAAEWSAWRDPDFDPWRLARWVPVRAPGELVSGLNFDWLMTTHAHGIQFRMRCGSGAI